MSRADFHQQYAARAEEQANYLLAQKPVLGTRWLDWVAGQLYQLTPAPYAAMVRRALEQAQEIQAGPTSERSD